MKKRTISIFLAVILIFILLPAGAAAGTLANFTAVRTYTPGQFSDVRDEWFAEYVQKVYEFGLIDGTSATTYSPKENLTIAQAIKLASCLHSIYNTGSSSFPSGSPWYQPYVDYALSSGIISSPYPDYNVNATRADFAVILAKALPDEALTPINTVEDNQIPDVLVSYTYGPSVYKLYRAGVLTGSDSAGTFYPNSYITRDAVAAIIARMAVPSLRQKVSLAPARELSATEIAAKCSPAVFYIELYNASGKAYASGSGFFISSSGVAVTNYHVIKGASSAKILTTDGKIYDVAGVYDFSVQNDLALLQINGSNFPYLEMGDSSKVVNGQKIYAIGSPRGLDNTITDGLVSNASRVINGVNYIQISAAISQGSSGGALIDAQGKVIGVTAALLDGAQNLNFAIPINLVKDLKQVSVTPLSSVKAPALTITPSQTSVTVALGAQVTITAKPSSDDYDSMGYLVDDESIITCNYAGMQGNAVALTITGIAVGRTSLSIALLDSDDNILAKTIIDVTVTMPVVRYYSGYGSVPDFGAFTGAPLAKAVPTESGSCAYYYRVEAIPVDPEVAFYGYFNLLENLGFEYITSITDEEGFYKYCFENSEYYVFLGLSYFPYSSVLCMLILVTPLD